MNKNSKVSRRIKAVALGVGIALVLAGVVGTAIKVTSMRKGKVARLQPGSVDREEAEAKARMDGEGGAKQPGSPVVT